MFGWVVFFRLFLLFVLVPFVELVLLIKIGSKIGWLPTLAIILLTGFLGAWLTRVQGVKTIQRYQQAMAEGRMPHREVVDGLLILLAGAILLTPGFLTDVAGFLLLVPAFRTVIRDRFSESLKTRIHIAGTSEAESMKAKGPSNVRQVRGRVIEDEEHD